MNKIVRKYAIFEPKIVNRYNKNFEKDNKYSFIALLLSVFSIILSCLAIYNDYAQYADTTKEKVSAYITNPNKWSVVFLNPREDMGNEEWFEMFLEKYPTTKTTLNAFNVDVYSYIDISIYNHSNFPVIINDYKIYDTNQKKDLNLLESYRKEYAYSGLRETEMDRSYDEHIVNSISNDDLINCRLESGDMKYTTMLIDFKFNQQLESYIKEYINKNKWNFEGLDQIIESKERNDSFRCPAFEKLLRSALNEYCREGNMSINYTLSIVTARENVYNFNILAYKRKDYEVAETSIPFILSTTDEGFTLEVIEK